MIDKNFQTDYNEAWQVVRVISATETSASLHSPGILGAMPLSAPIFRCRAKIIAMRIFANVNDANPIVGVYAEAPQDGDKYPMGNNVLLGTVACTGVSIALLNPFTKEVSADTWYASGEFTAEAAGHNANQITQVPAAANTGFEMRFILDTVGDTLWYPYATSMGSTAATKIIVAMKKIE